MYNVHYTLYNVCCILYLSLVEFSAEVESRSSGFRFNDVGASTSVIQLTTHLHVTTGGSTHQPCETFFVGGIQLLET